MSFKLFKELVDDFWRWFAPLLIMFFCVMGLIVVAIFLNQITVRI